MSGADDSLDTMDRAWQRRQSGGSADPGDFPELSDEEYAELEAKHSDRRTHRLSPDDRRFKETYEAGEKAGRQKAKARHAKKATAKKTARKATKKAAAPARRAARRSAGRAERGIQAGASQILPAAGRQITSGYQALGYSIALAGLYLVLTNSKAVAGFIGGASRGLRWLASPNSSIPYAPTYSAGGTEGLLDDALQLGQNVAEFFAPGTGLLGTAIDIVDGLVPG